MEGYLGTYEDSEADFYTSQPKETLKGVSSEMNENQLVETWHLKL